MKTRPTRVQEAETFNRFVKLCALDTSLSYNICGGDERTFNGSLRDIQDEYGRPCAQLFQLLFIKWQRGGYSLDKRAGYKSTWHVDQEVVQAFRKIMRDTYSPLQRAQDVLAELKKLGYEPKERVKKWKREFERWELAEQRILSGSALAEWKKKQREINDQRRHEYGQTGANYFKPAH